MKRTYIIHLLICVALGLAAGILLAQAIIIPSILHGIFATIMTVACVLNLACGPDDASAKN